MNLILALAPALFVTFWSSGFVAAKLAVPFAEPCTFLFLRFTIVLVALMPFVLFAKTRPSGPEARATLVAGVLMQGLYLSCVVWSIYLGLPAGVVALTVSLHPITTALTSRAVLGEHISALGWLGFVLGVLGALLVLWPKLDLETGSVPSSALILCVLALPFMSSGTVFQRRFAPNVAPVAATCIQHVGAVIVTGLGALAFETRVIDWAPLMIGSLIWQSVVVSIGAVVLLLLMLRARGASRASSVFFLVPAGSAALTYVFLGEDLKPVQLLGMVVVTGAVVLIGLGSRIAHAARPSELRMVTEKE
ncbi:MAG: DMT family transporter [Hyphomicrobiaceae bacterium]